MAIDHHVMTVSREIREVFKAFLEIPRGLILLDLKLEVSVDLVTAICITNFHVNITPHALHDLLNSIA